MSKYIKLEDIKMLINACEWRIYADSEGRTGYGDEWEFIDTIVNALSVVPSRETGRWVLDPNGMDWNIPAWRCSECGFVANYIGVEANGLGSNPMNWAGSNYCPNCGARMESDE